MNTACHTTTATIFIVDDDRGLTRLVEKALQREGFRTAAASSFKDASEWLKSHDPDLLLLDLHLDEIDGEKLIDQLRAQERSLPFVVITGRGDERVAVTMMKRGALDYLVKDADFLDFVPDVVRRALGQLERDRKLAAAEEALRRSEANLAKAQHIAHMGSYDLNVPWTNSDYRSAETLRILGLPTETELSTREYAERIVHEADREYYGSIVERTVRDGKPFDFEYRIVRPDGSVRHVQSVGEPVFDASGKVTRVVGTLLDITARKKAERRQEVQYQIARTLAESATLTEAAPKLLSAVCQSLGWEIGELWQVNTKSNSLRCIERWDSLAKSEIKTPISIGSGKLAHGHGLPGTVWRTGKALWSSDIGKDRRFWRTSMAVGEGIRCAVGFPVLAGETILGVLVLFSREIQPQDDDLMQTFAAIGNQISQFSERKRAEERLKKEHAFSSTVLDTSAALIVVLDRHGNIVRFNRACEQTTGYSAAEVQGKLIWDLFISPEESKAVRSVFANLKAERVPSRHENHWLTREGGRRLIAWSNSALEDDDRSVEYVIGVGIDVTERRRLEREILQISEIEQRRIGRDLHDGLCQQLAATELMSQILEQKLVKKSKADANRASEIARHVREAISQTRLLARGLSPVVLESEGLMSALHELTEYTEKMFRVKCHFLCSTPVLIDDNNVATHLYRLAQEAISNAIRHGKAKRIDVTLEKVESGISVSIRDDGLGLPADVSKAKGMGLRIMCYRAAMIGGLLSFDRPSVGSGTSVTCLIQKDCNFKDKHPHEHVKGTKEIETEGPDRR